MGDIPLQSGASADFPRHETRSGAFVASSGAPAQAAPEYVPTHAPGLTQQQQSPYGGVHHAFSSQLDVAQAQGQPPPQVRVSSGPYNMGAMEHALPQAAYRPSPYNTQQQQHHNHQQYQHQHQGHARFQSSAAPSGPPGVAPQLSASQFGAQSGLNPQPSQHQYYLAQNAAMQAYYPTALAPQAPLSSSSSPPPRHGLGYYSGALFMGQQPHQLGPQYFYGQPIQFQTQAHHVQATLIPGQYMHSNPQHVDPIAAQAQLQASAVVDSAAMSPLAAHEQGSSQSHTPLPFPLLRSFWTDHWPRSSAGTSRGPPKCGQRATKKTTPEW
jgi:hypothetical protein